MSGVSLNYQGTTIAASPTIAGPVGKAWRCELPDVGKRAVQDWDATVGVYIVRAPGAHLMWDHWVVSVIHLRQIEGVRPETIHVDGATHELMIFALNPEEPLPTTLQVGADGWRVRYLFPIDVVQQFAAADDVVADKILELSVWAIVNGHLSPDQDWRSAWKASIAETARHFAEGRHSETRS